MIKVIEEITVDIEIVRIEIEIETAIVPPEALKDVMIAEIVLEVLHAPGEIVMTVVTDVDGEKDPAVDLPLDIDPDAAPLPTIGRNAMIKRAARRNQISLIILNNLPTIHN
jgi:hypothetical protein